MSWYWLPSCSCRRAVPSRVLVAPLLLLACSLVVSGCGGKDSGPERFHVGGTVTFQGQPVPTGRILFEPDASKGNLGPVSVTGINNGKYDTDHPGVKGPVPGALVVRITGYPEPDPNVEMPKELFPEYQTTVDLAPAGAKTTLDFDVPAAAR